MTGPTRRPTKRRMSTRRPSENSANETETETWTFGEVNAVRLPFGVEVAVVLRQLASKKERNHVR
jgi:hypothetical protein